MGTSMVERKHPPSWDADGLEKLCLSITRNVFSEVKFDREPGLSISQHAVHSVFLNWEQTCFETFSFCLLHVL